MKLSPKQAEIIRLMKEGWELNYHYGSAWLQKEGCGWGKSVNFSTFHSLFIKGFIRPELTSPNIYKLTEKGEKVC